MAEFNASIDLGTYRFEREWLFSSVERIVVNESEQIDGEQEFIWRCFV
jgi:hypothetical protein